jgi:hypothetical protein
MLEEEMTLALIKVSVCSSPERGRGRRCPNMGMAVGRGCPVLCVAVAVAVGDMVVAKRGESKSSRKVSFPLLRNLSRALFLSVPLGPVPLLILRPHKLGN